MSQMPGPASRTACTTVARHAMNPVTSRSEFTMREREPGSQLQNAGHQGFINSVFYCTANGNVGSVRYYILWWNENSVQLPLCFKRRNL